MFLLIHYVHDGLHCGRLCALFVLDLIKQTRIVFLETVHPLLLICDGNRPNVRIFCCHYGFGQFRSIVPVANPTEKPWKFDRVSAVQRKAALSALPTFVLTAETHKKLARAMVEAIREAQQEQAFQAMRILAASQTIGTLG